MKVIQPVILNAGDPNGVRAIAVRKVKRLKLESNIDRPDPVSDGQWTKLTNFAARCSVSAMTTITTHEAKTHLSRYLAEVEKGREFVIARGNSAVAMLVPLKTPAPRRRPKEGEIKGKPFEFPAAAFAPLTARELKEWGL